MSKSIRMSVSRADSIVAAVMHETVERDFLGEAIKIAQDDVMSRWPDEDHAVNAIDPSYLSRQGFWMQDLGHIYVLGAPCMLDDDPEGKDEPIMSDAGNKRLRALAKLASRDKAKRKKIRAELRATLLSFTTLKAAREGLPHLARFIDAEDEVPMQLPSTIPQLEQDLRELGVKLDGDSTH